MERERERESKREIKKRRDKVIRENVGNQINQRSERWRREKERRGEEKRRKREDT